MSRQIILQRAKIAGLIEPTINQIAILEHEFEVRSRHLKQLDVLDFVYMKAKNMVKPLTFDPVSFD